MKVVITLLWMRLCIILRQCLALAWFIIVNCVLDLSQKIEMLICLNFFCLNRSGDIGQCAAPKQQAHCYCG